MGCSTITLDHVTHVPAHITIMQSSLHIIGPGSGALTIDEGLYASIRHVGYGTLDIEGVTVANGKYASANQAFGGCIYSKGSVTLSNARVDGCYAIATSASNAGGGAIFAGHDLEMNRSSVSGSHANGFGSGSSAYGGGIYVGGSLTATYSTIDNNKASGAVAGVGGGATVLGMAITIQSSTVSANQADTMGGLYFKNSLGTAEIVDSTISGNTATNLSGALYARGGLKLANTTVAFNHDNFVNYAGVSAGGPSLIPESSILAGNGGAGGPADLFVQPATTVSGSNNLVIAATGVSMTPADCPRLAPLANNGGPTLTHALGQTSPAINAGSNPEHLVFDQTGNSRVDGISPDIGAVEWRAGLNEERIFVTGFDGLCDQ
jgi:hypothetical protein